MNLAIAETLRHTSWRRLRAVVIPAQIPRKDYEQLDALLRAAGGRWTRSAKAHIFPSGTDTRLAISRAIEAGRHLNANPHEFFPTSPELALRLASDAVSEDHVIRIRTQPATKLRILEPSAGRGALLTALWSIVPKSNTEIAAFELDPDNADVLRSIGVDAYAKTF